MAISDRTKREQERGAQRVALLLIAEKFDPNYVRDPGISPEERARRDEQRKLLGQWKRIHEGQEP